MSRRIRDATDLEGLLDQLDAAARDDDPVSVDSILDVLGYRSFGPILTVSGLILIAPLVGDIPGVSATVGLLVLLTTSQIVFRHEHIWLPAWIRKRSIEREKFRKALDWLRRPASYVDRIIRPRASALTEGAAAYVIAGVCMVTALAAPVMEFVPFSAIGAGLAWSAFGLSLIAHDGLLATLALVFTAATSAFVAIILF